jgi:hypothetical protein
MEVIKSYNLFLDSSQLDYSDVGNPASYFMFLRKPITKSAKSSQFRIKIFQACIPFSFTEINASNNILSYTYNSSPYTLTIPIGSYSITALLTYIQTYIQTTHTITLNFTFNTSTNLSNLAFALTQTGSHSITFTYIPSNKLVLKQMGFLNATTFSITSGVLLTATSAQSVNVSPSKNLYIRSDNLQQGANSQEAISTKIILSDILAIIPINVPFGNYINYYDTTSFFVYINNETIDGVSLYLTDATSDQILTGLLLNWSCSMIIEEVLIKSDINVEHITGQNLISKQNDKIVNQLETDKQNAINELQKERERLMNEIINIKGSKK